MGCHLSPRALLPARRSCKESFTMENGLFERVCQLDATELRQVVLGLCLNPKNKEAVLKHIKLLPREGATKPAQPQPSNPATGSAQPAPGAQNHPPQGAKTHTSRRSSVHTTPYTRQKCENCDFWFTAIDNADKACRFHPGMLLRTGVVIYYFLQAFRLTNHCHRRLGR